MTIDEAIARERQQAEIHRNNIVPKEDYHNMPWIDKNNEASMRNAEEHEQIAEWLEELKEYKKNSNTCPMCDTYCSYIAEEFENGYNKAIDDFVEFASTMPTVEQKDGTIRPMWLKEMAEQLKEGGENEQNI